MSLRYLLEEEDKKYSDLIDTHNYFLHSLLPNSVNIHSLESVHDKDILDYVKHYYKQLKYLIYPVIKHKWCKTTVFVSIETDSDGYRNVVCDDPNVSTRTYEFYNIGDEQNKLLLKYIFKNHDEEVVLKNNNYVIKRLNLIMTLEAYSIIYGRTFDLIDDKLVTYNFILGVVFTAAELGIMSIPFKQKNKISQIRSKNSPGFLPFKFSIINLKSLYISNQIRIFETWLEKKDVLLTGGTGIGKTSQIPKLYWWINFLYDGIEDTDIDFGHFKLSFLALTMRRPTSRPTVLSLPRKILIKDNSLTVASSLGFEEIYNSPIDCKFKDVRNSKFYNKLSQQYITPFVFSINRNTNLKNPNTIIFDEIHEHNTFCDIGIATVKKYKKKYNIRNLILITATIVDDLEILKAYLPNMVHIDIIGKTLYSITEIDKSKECNLKNNYDNVEEIINTYSTEIGMSTIFFFPTISMINNMFTRLSSSLDKKKFVIIQLHREALLKSDHDLVQSIQKYKQHHVIVLSSPIAESSLTIRNAKVVLDTGLFYAKQFYSGERINITQSMMQQRKGRVGRKSVGIYIRLFSLRDLNLTYKKIDYEFLLPYIIYCFYYGIKFNELFILPSDMSRFDKTIKYFNKKNVYLEEDSFKIFHIFQSKPCNIGEYLIVYLYGTEEQINFLSLFEEYENTSLKINLLNQNKFLTKYIAKKMNIKVDLKPNTGGSFVKEYRQGRIKILKYYEDLQKPFGIFYLTGFFPNNTYLFSDTLVLN